MSPLPAWIGAAFGMLLALTTGSQAGVPLPFPAAVPVAAAALVTPSMSPVVTEPSCAPGWSEPDTSYRHSILASVVSNGPDAWAVGLTTVSEDPRYPLAVHWDGTSWVQMPIEQSRHEQALFGLDRSPTGRMWAAGYRTRSSLYYPMMMRWNGTTWAVASLGAVSSRGGALLSVRARSDALTWAVGYKIGKSGQRPLAIRRVGTGWQDASPGIPAAATGVLMDIDARSSNDAWGVGWIVDRGAPKPYLAHWNGAHWTRGHPVEAGSEGALTSVAMIGPHDVWAVGYRVSGGVYRPTVQHWDGHSWRLVAFPIVTSTVAMLRGVQIDVAGRPVVVGTRWDTDTKSWRGLAARREDGVWQLMDAPPMLGGSEFRDLATRPAGDAWVVGATGAQSLAIQVCTEPTDGTGPVDGGPTPSPTPGVIPSAIPDASVPPTMSPDPIMDPSPAASPMVSPVVSPLPSASVAPIASQMPSPPPLAPRGGPVVARDVTAAAGLTLETSSYGAVRADFNVDGWPDLFIGRHSNPGWMVFNDGHGFADAPGVSIPRRDRHGCTSGDVNGDGLPDLYCANGAFHGAGFKGNELYLQQPDGTFLDEAMAMHATDPFGRGRLTALFDLDHDQYADLFLADRPARPDGLPSLDRVLANPHGDGYVGQSVAGFDASGGADCLRAADLNHDGWQDIVLCERAMDRTNAYGIRILRNMHGRLVDITAGSGIEKRQAVDAIVTDVNGDHQLDIVEVTPFSLRIHLQHNGRFTLGYERPLTDGVAVAAGDVDRDGDRDLYVVQGTRAKQRNDLMLINRGDGRGFSQLPLPQATGGSAESVTAIDYDRNGLTDFLVLNGKGALNPGPVQLIAFFPKE
jgi:FG-GAP-like repeat